MIRKAGNRRRKEKKIVVVTLSVRQALHNLRKINVIDSLIGLLPFSDLSLHSSRFNLLQEKYIPLIFFFFHPSLSLPHVKSLVNFLFSEA